MLLQLLFLLAAPHPPPPPPAAPAPAPAQGQGRAAVDCRVAPGGRLEDCRLVSEMPLGANVGGFALQLARNTRVAPDDRRIRNGRIVLVLRMKLP